MEEKKKIEGAVVGPSGPRRVGVIGHMDHGKHSLTAALAAIGATAISAAQAGEEVRESDVDKMFREMEVNLVNTGEPKTRHQYRPPAHLRNQPGGANWGHEKPAKNKINRKKQAKASRRKNRGK